MKKVGRIVLVFTLLVFVGCSSKREEKLERIELVPEADQVQVGTDTKIQIITDPSKIQLGDEDFKSTGGKIEVDGSRATFSSAEEGKFTISATKDGIRSNTVTITVVEDDQEDLSNDPPIDEDPSSQVDEVVSNDPPCWRKGKDASPDAIDVATVLADPSAYVGKTISVVGSLPQALAYDADGTGYMVLIPQSTIGSADMNDPSARLRFTAVDLNMGDCIAELTGVLKQEHVGNDDYVFHVTSGYMIENLAVGPACP